MSFTPNVTEQIARARADLRMGVPVVLTGTPSYAVLAIETLTEDRLSDAHNLGFQIHVAVTARRAETLKARVYDGDIARITLPTDVTLSWLRAIADPKDDLRNPMKGPFATLRDNNAGAARIALRLIKSAQLLPAAVMIELPDPSEFAKTHSLTALACVQIDTALDAAAPMHPVVAARLPMAASEAGRVHVFRPASGAEEHYAIEIGRPDRAAPVLARLHSACFTGDVLGSLKCDCGPQLRGALAQMGQAGSGVLLYLNQEGRGIGLANKMRAYSLQDQGFDTVEANHRLGFEDDERDFRIGTDILRRMGFSQVRLLTNNPRKIKMMEQCGITVTERVPLIQGVGDHNRAYLATKAAKSGHLL